MPARMITVKAKTKAGLKEQAEKEIRDAAKRGFQYIKQGYNDKRVKKVKGGYEIEIEVHS